MDKARILIVEDDADNGRSLVDAIEDLGYEAELAPTAQAGLAAFQARGADVALVDLVLPDRDGITVLQAIRERDAGRTPVMLMTAYASVETSVRAMKEGAYDYLQKPLDIDELQTKLARALEAARLRRQVAQLSQEIRNRWAVTTWVAESPAMREVVRQTLALAATSATVLIRGDSGTGKELVARALHAEGPRAPAPFVAVNCAAFTESLLESELFGHEKGAFTGAVARHAGAFERADGGTLFLDEIGELPIGLQAKLLRVLEDKTFTPLGASRPVCVDVRLVSATNTNLEAACQEGRFRMDLMYRLKSAHVCLPPLRERRGDIPLLVSHFLKNACARHQKNISGFSPEAMRLLTRGDYPGNIRELSQMVENAALLTAGPVILPADLGGNGAALDLQGDIASRRLCTLRENDSAHVRFVMDATGGNRREAAEILGITLRQLQRKLADMKGPF